MFLLRALTHSLYINNLFTSECRNKNIKDATDAL